MDIWKEVRAVEDYTIRCRRYIHENPELSDMEENTVAFILKELTDMGITCTNVPQGGVLGFINGVQDGKTILLRADIDALPVEEDPKNNKTEKVCVSKIPGVSHACGHDAHTAMLLGAAKILNDHRKSLNGNIVLYFERGEEAGNGDYYLVKHIQDNRIHIDGCWAMHVSPAINTGAIGLLTGGVMAGSLFFGSVFSGENALACAVSIINSLNTARMREIDPYEAVTLTPTRLQFKEDGSCHISGTCRYYNSEKVGRRMRDIVQNIISQSLDAYGCTVVREIPKGPVGQAVSNNAACYAIAKDALSRVLGADMVQTCEPNMGSESFSTLANYYPSLYVYLGCANEQKGMSAMLHSPQFDPDENCFKTGIAATVAYTLAFLSTDAPIPFSPFEGNIDQYLEHNRS